MSFIRKRKRGTELIACCCKLCANISCDVLRLILHGSPLINYESISYDVSLVGDGMNLFYLRRR